jgi:hypothetical protein
MGALRFGDPPRRVRAVLGDPDKVYDPDYAGLLCWRYRTWRLNAVFWKETPQTEATGDNTPLHAFESKGEFVTFSERPLVGMHVRAATAVLRDAGLDPDGEPVDVGNGFSFQLFAGGVTLNYQFDSVSELMWERVKSPGDERWTPKLIRDYMAGMPPHNPPMQQTGAAGVVSLIRKLLERGSGR